MKQGTRTLTQQELADNKTAFGRWRLRCPYGLWTCADGREVLFNRYYRPIYERYPGQPARAACDQWVDWQKQQWFFDDGTAPVSYGSVPRRAWLPAISRINKVLTDWGLDSLPPRPAKPR